MAKRWHYIGDINIRYGGTYYKESGWHDHVYYVDVIPCDCAGGPENLFWIESGSIYLGNARVNGSAIECCGMAGPPSIIELADCVKIHGGGTDGDSTEVVRIGKHEDAGCGFHMPEIDTILRSNASLRRYVERNYLGSN